MHARCQWVLLARAIALLLLVPGALAAQEEDLANSEAEAVEELADDVFVAPVIFEGETLFLVRGSSALPADERAAKIVERLEEIAEASESLDVEFEIREGEFGNQISIDGRMATITTEADSEFEQMDIGVLAGLQAEAIQAAIITYRDERSDSALVESAVSAIAWSAAFLLISVLFFRYRTRFSDRLAQLTESRFSQVEEATGSIVRGKAVAALVRFATNAAQWILYFVALYYYLSFVLLSFAETRPIAQLLLDYVSRPLINIGAGIVGFLPNLITLIIIAFVTQYFIKALRLFFDNVEAGVFKMEFEPHWITPTFYIARVVIILIALVFAYPFIPGSDSAVFQGLTILAGIMLSLGSNTVVSNMMAGLFVIYRRSTNIGDRIQVGDKVGDVVEIKLMETLIKSLKNEMISIPNAQLLNSEVVNYSRQIDGRGLLVHTTVGIGYEEPPKKVKAMLVEAARRTRGIRKSPEPFVLWTKLADYAINYQINAFIGRGERLPIILSDLHENIMTVFTENGTQIMTPSYEADPEEPKIPPVDWDGKLAHLE